MSFLPTEVTLDAGGAQVLPLLAGSPYPRYTLCVRGCGYLVGTTEIVSGASHHSCLLALSTRHNVGTYPARPPQMVGESIGYPLPGDA